MNKEYKIVLNKFDGNEIDDNIITKVPYNRDFAEKYSDGVVEVLPEIEELARKIKDERHILVRN